MEITDRFKQNIARHPEVPILISLFALYMFLSNFFVWSLAFQDNYLNVSGGSDPYFNYYIVQYILNTHTQLTHTILLNYPVGTVNARPPFYQWSIIFAGYLISPFTGLKMGAYYAFLESDAFYGALLIIPIYFITKPIFGKKAGLFAALLFTIMPGNLTSGILTDGRAHTPELIFAFLSIYFFEMAIITAKKRVIINKLTDVRSYFTSVKNYYEENKITTIYTLMSAVSLGGLIVFWQGFPYIEVILLIYVAVQLLYNLFAKKPTGYLTYISTIYVAASFPIGFYYYDVTSMLHAWFLPPLAMGLMLIGFAILINIVARKPWIITIPALVLVTLAGLFIISKTNPAILKELITGDGYFVKSRVYSTIAEAAPLPLGQYISDFGPGLFLLGIAGVPFIIYRFLKTKSEGMLVIIIFSIFSIFMSFEAGRFNITAAPAYAILGGGLLMYFVDIIRHNEATKKSRHVSGKKSLRKNISGVTVSFAVIVVLIMIIPSGMGAFSAAVPENNAASYDHILNSTVPKGLRPDNPFGNYGLVIDNKTQPLAASFQWLAEQNSNVSIQNRPGYVSWWDYGFQELEEGQHPTVADDFQQGIASAGQMLLAQNQTQEISLFISRVLQTPGGYSNGHFNKSITAELDKYFGVNETNIIAYMFGNPLAPKYLPLLSEKAYGDHVINVTTSYNARHALIMGQLSTKYNLTILISAYSALERVTGSSLSYIQVDHELYPFSGSNPGIFYAPAYLTDTPSYTADGEVVPINYYNVVAVTSTGAQYTLNKLPKGVAVTNYLLNYTSTFYNTTIYKIIYGFPESYVDHVTHVYPAFNMSNFELVYYASEYNPHKNANSTTPGWTLIPIQEAYTYQQEKKGTEVLLPASLIGDEDPIIEYYPGAVISGRVTTSTGAGVAGVHVTIEDQYGIPHEVVTTNNTGYYSITGLPGNDTLIFSTGSVSSDTLNGTTIINTQSVEVSKDQGNRIGNYNITQNLKLPRNNVYGYVTLNNGNSTAIMSGNVTFTNTTYGVNRTVPITNGIYSMNDIEPYEYNITVRSNNEKYANFTKVYVTDVADQLQNLTVKMDTIDVSASINSYGLSGYNVYVNSTSGNKVFTGVTSSSGSYSFNDIAPGTYNITIKANGTEDKSNVTISGWGESKSVSLTPELAATVSGYAIPGAKISFYFDGDTSDVKNATANGTGYYNISMPYGIYTIYSNTISGVFVKTINVTRNMVQNISYSTAHLYTINSTMNNTKDYSGIYEILANKSTTQNYSLLEYNYANSSKPYTIYLPAGTYSFAGIGKSSGKTMAGFNISTTAYNININLVYNSTYKYSILTSSNTTQGYASQGIMVISNNSTPYFYSQISGGKAYIYALNNSKMVIESPFYHGPVQSVSNVVYNASQNMVNISIEVHNDTKLVDYNGTVTLIGLYNSYTFNMTKGVASHEVAEGVYYTMISNKSAYIVPNITGTAVNSSLNQTFIKDSDLYFTFKNINNTITGIVTTLYNSTGVNVGISHLPAGNYTLYSANSTMVNVSYINLNKNTSINVTYVKGYNVTITNNLSISTPYHITYKNEILTTPSRSNITVLLPSINFTITASGNYTNSTGAYTYLNKTANYITPSSTNKSIEINLVPTEVYDKISGNVYYYTNGTHVSGVSVELLKNGNKYNSTTSSATGAYNFTKLTPGTYGIYANYTYNGNDYAYFQNVTLQPFKNITYNVTLESGYKVTLTGTNSSTPVPTNLTIVGGSPLVPSMYIMSDSITHSIILPGNETYKFTMLNTTVKSTIPVNYSTSETIFLNSTYDKTLALHEDYIPHYVLMDPSVSGYVGENVTTNVTIYNKGNTNGTLYLYSGNSTWKLSFNPNNFTIPSGRNQNVTVNITIPIAPAGNNYIPVMAEINSTKYHIGNITVDVIQGTSYKVTYSPYAEVNGTVNLIPITLKNTNNTKITVYVNITNAITLYKIDDIYTNIIYNGKTVTNVNLSAGQVANLYIQTYGIKGTTLHSVPMYFESNATIYGKNTYHNVTITPVLPSATVGAGSSGPHIISDYTANPAITIYIGIGIIVAALLAGIIGSSIRSRKKR